MSDSKSKFELLQEILLEEDRKKDIAIQSKVDEIEADLTVKERLEPKVEPIIDKKINYLRENFPELFGPAITQAIRVQIRESQDEVVDALYPIMGKMIKKYIIREVELLNERVEKRIEEIFSFQALVHRVRKFFGLNHKADLVTSTLVDPSIENVYLIEQDSGIVIATYNKKTGFEEDLIAGMLTAIKSFVKDAYKTGDQELENIQYENFTIYLKNLKRFYISIVLDGPISNEFKNRLEKQVLNFLDEIINKKIREEHLEVGSATISKELKTYFGGKIENG